MEVIEHENPHITLLRAAADPYLLILVGYISFVVVLLAFLTRSALDDGLFTIPSKASAIKHKLALTYISLAATWY